MHTESLLVKTDQAWKFNLLCMAVVFSGMVAYFGDLYLGDKAYMVGSALFLTAVLWSVVSIRCPRCKARWLVNAVCEKDHRIWDVWLVSLEFCPECEYPSDPAHAKEGTYLCPRCDQLSNNPDFCDLCSLDMRTSKPAVVMPDATETQ